MAQRTFLWLGILALILAACAPAAQATPAPTATRAPGVAATATPTPTPAVGTTPTAKPAVTPTRAQAQPKYGGTLTIGERVDPTSWDPHTTVTGSREIRRAHNMVFQQLFALPSIEENKCQFKVVPQLAESWRWANDTTFEVTIKQGVRFQNTPPVNGREMTAEDVAWSLNRYRKLSPMLASIGRSIKDVVVADRYKVQFITDSPLPAIYAAYLPAPYGAVVVAKESAGKTVGKEWEYPWLDNSWIGTGPFLFKTYAAGVKLFFDRNPNYWKQGLPYVDGIESLIVPDASTRLAMFRSGRLHVWLEDLPYPFVVDLKRSGDAQLFSCPSSNPIRLFMRTDKPPFNDVRVRRALSMAVNREAWLNTVMQGNGVMAAWVAPIAPMFLAPQDYPADVRKYLAHNPQEARRLLAEAGYPNGFQTTLQVRRLDTPWNEIMESTDAMLGDVGIQVKMIWETPAVHNTTVSVGNQDALGWTHNIDSDAYSVLARFHSKSGWRENRSHVVDPKMDAMVDEFMRTLDEKRAAELAAQIQIYSVDQAFAIVAPSNLAWAAAGPSVRNFTLGGLPRYSLWAERIWLDK